MSCLLVRCLKLFRLKGCWEVVFFFSNCDRTFCKQTVETLIRCRIVGGLVWVSTVCMCRTKRTLGLKWLMFERSSVSIFCEASCKGWSMKCEVWTVKFELNCQVGSLNCDVRSLNCEVLMSLSVVLNNVIWKNNNYIYEVWSVKLELWSWNYEV